MDTNQIKSQLVRDPSKYARSNEGESSVTSNIPLERFQTLEATIRNNPITSAPYVELGSIYLGRKQWNDARRILEQAATRFPDEDLVLTLLEDAQLGRSTQQFEAAKGDFEEARTDSTREFFDRCRIELDVLAERVFNNRILRHPDDMTLKLRYANALERVGKIEEATNVLQTVVAIPEFRAPAAFQLGQLFEKLGRVPEALSAYRRAAFFRIPEPSMEQKQAALESAATLAEKNGMIDSARRYVSALLELQPDRAEIKERLIRLESHPV